MTAHRASLLGLVGLVFSVFVAAASCNLDASGFGETDEELCSDATHCDDLDICTEDTCGEDGICVRVAAPDGLFPDGVQGNCKVLECKGGQSGEAAAPEDMDDGNPCTDDACEGATPTHTVITGAPCQSQGGQSTCNAQGECVAPECGHLGADGEEVGCPPSASDCTLSYCDKAKGKCVEEKLDGVPVPNATAPTECGGSYCVDGVETGVEAPVDSPCALADGDAGRCSPEGKCVECYQKSHCDTGLQESLCHSFGCTNDECFAITQPDGPLAAQMTGNCRLQICSAGLYDNQVDNADIPFDDDDCTQDLCVDGTPSNPPAAVNTKCGAGGLLYCDGSGNCKGCNTDDQCLGATDCKTPFCDLAADQCDFMNAAMGTMVTAQNPGDCKTIVCDGNGNFTNQYAADDPENDANDCTTDTCTAMDMTSHMPVMKGSTCDDGGGVVCDAVAHCVGAPCGGAAQCPVGTNCIDGVCCESMCGGTCNACSSVKKGGGPNGLCGPISVGDPDGNDCPGNSGCSAGVCLPLAQGAACQGVTMECATGFCADGVCCGAACNGTCQACNLSGMAGTCGNVPNLSDPANECANGACNGAGACKLDNGQTCSMGSQCLTGNCIDGVCCNTTCGATCQACNVMGSLGTCTNVPNNQDPASECANGACNGGGQCKLDNGQPCVVGGDCLTGNCPAADGVCCNAACSGVCQACVATKTGGANGTCGNVQSMTDPDNECVATTSCNGAGACNKQPNGSPCTQNAECNSNICSGDGVCCNAACSGVCQACDLAGSNGTCTSIASGQDPDAECAGTHFCNGSNSCRKVVRDTCAASSECLLGNCVDGVCCGTTCNGACQACNLAGNVGACTSIPSGLDPANECSGTQVCNGAGGCRKVVGDTCALSSECLLGNCVDGRCCDSACNGLCEACNLGTPGMCSSVANGQDPANECAGVTSCNGSGQCTKLPLGATCSANTECNSGFCVDGACCGTSSCAGTCTSCNPAETVGGVAGACDLIVEDTDPDNECANGGCTGTGACQEPLGSTCTDDSECASGFCADGVCCNGACDQECEECSAAGLCTNHPENTDPELDCPGAQICSMLGTCVNAPNGNPCPATGADANCVSGWCADGVCCGAECAGDCQACDLTGTEGACTLIPAGTDPEEECPGALVCNAGSCVTP